MKSKPLLLIVSILLLLILGAALDRPSSLTMQDPNEGFRVPSSVIMSKMVNETLKAQLGRSSWHLLHTMAGKFPLHPSPSEKQAMLDFVRLFAQLYPCGDCARHFQSVLVKHPPIVTNRNSTRLWACTVHNVVNERLKKPIFDCSKVGEVWQCGCGDEEE